MGITEVKGKNNRYTHSPGEFSIDMCYEYNLFHRNIDNTKGRGMLLYVHNTLHAEEVKFTKEVEETLFIKLWTSKAENMLVGIVYRSPSDNSEEKNQKLRDVINEAAKGNYSQFVIMGEH
jgi:hypothetical protein